MRTVYETCIGIDAGKTAHRACAVDSSGEVLFNAPVANAERDIDAMLARAPGRTLVVVDQRRNIGMLAIRRARAAGLDVAYLPGIAMSRAASLFPGDAKTDERDAMVIAMTAMGVPGSLRPVPEEDPRAEKLRRLAAQRSDLLACRTHQKNRMRALLLESNPAFEAAVDLGCPWMLALLSEFGGPWNLADAGRRRFLSWCRRTLRVDMARAEAVWSSTKEATRVTEGQVEAEGYLVRSIAARIAADGAEIERASAMIEAGLKGDAVYDALLTIPGVGPKTAAQLVLTVDISDFRGHDELASYAGLAPRNRQSGTSLSSVAASREGNKALKNLLVYSCMSLIGSDGYYGRYYDACRSRGMRHKQALKAVARKRLKVIYAVMRDSRPYTA